jgi:hypothetical protein
MQVATCLAACVQHASTGMSGGSFPGTLWVCLRVRRSLTERLGRYWYAVRRRPLPRHRAREGSTGRHGAFFVGASPPNWWRGSTFCFAWTEGNGFGLSAQRVSHQHRVAKAATVDCTHNQRPPRGTLPHNDEHQATREIRRYSSQGVSFARPFFFWHSLSLEGRRDNHLISLIGKQRPTSWSLIAARPALHASTSYYGAAPSYQTPIADSGRFLNQRNTHRYFKFEPAANWKNAGADICIVRGSNGESQH